MVQFLIFCKYRSFSYLPLWARQNHQIPYISDLILNKTESLTADEYTLIKNHASEGEKIIDSIISAAGDEFFLKNAKLFAGHHHERWDGTGYPRGLKGADIPLQGRIMAIADVYDALVSDRPYKNAFPHEEAVKIIRESRESHFDPKIVDIFLEVNELFAEESNVPDAFAHTIAINGRQRHHALEHSA